MKGFVDSNLVLSDAQAITATASSTNDIKLPNTTVGEGAPLYLHVAVDTAFVTGANTLKIDLEDSADGVTYAATELILAATATSGLVTANTEILRWPLPSNTKQWIQLYYTCSATLTSGTIDAWVGYH